MGCSKSQNGSYNLHATYCHSGPGTSASTCCNSPKSTKGDNTTNHTTDSINESIGSTNSGYILYYSGIDSIFLISAIDNFSLWPHYKPGDNSFVWFIKLAPHLEKQEKGNEAVLNDTTTTMENARFSEKLYNGQI
eukprot:1959489-Ditylum_brightwellii.AAC.1